MDEKKPSDRMVQGGVLLGLDIKLANELDAIPYKRPKKTGTFLGRLFDSIQTTDQARVPMLLR